jgi:diguanylate cyclase (GGDEF)-like protein
MANLSTPTGFWRALIKPRQLLQILLWPVLCGCMAGAMWVLVEQRAESERQRVEQAVLGRAAALSRAVAKSVARSVAHVDELSEDLRWHWEEHSRDGIRNALAHNTEFARQWLSFVGIADRNGRVVSSNAAQRSLPSLADDASFRYHREHATRALLIGAVASGEPAIVFSRRLERPGGAFDGVLVLHVRPSYLTSFYDEASFGKGGYLAIRGANAVLYAANVGGLDVERPLPEAWPVPGTAAGTRILQEPARLLAWQPVGAYPMLVVVGLAADEAMAPYRGAPLAYRRSAKVASWLLAVAALVGTLGAIMLVHRRQLSQEIRDAYRLATEGANEGFFFLRALYDQHGAIEDFIIEDCNRTGAALGGVERAQLIGLRLSDLPRISDLMTAAEIPSQLAIGRMAMQMGIVEDEWTAAATSSFRGLWLHRTIRRVGSGLALTMRDVSAAKGHEKKMLALAHEDTVTKLPNRHWLLAFLPCALARARQNNWQLAVFFIDIDNFKQVNDTLGHGAGDALLHVAGMRLKAELRPGDSMARLGGDEFTIVLEHIASAGDAQLVAARIVEALSHPIELGSGTAKIGSSIGISLFPGDGEDVDTLLRHADIAMYAAKAAGKGRYCFFEREQYQSMMDRIDTQVALERAVRNGQFVMYYQPRLSSDSGAICGMEALVRWQHPERGLLAPKEFIGLAESSGLIVLLGKLVMEMVCAQIEQWIEMNLPLVPVSFNVSASEFNHGDVRSQLARCIERHHLHPDELEIELTESTLVDEKGDAMNALADIRKMGVKCLVDDFGTGFSSLSQLQRLDTDILKIDQSFTAQLGRTKKAETFFRAIVSMADALEMGVVAEGVETIEQLHLLQLLGCKEVQGYYMCPPVPGPRMAELLRKRFMMTREGVLL